MAMPRASALLLLLGAAAMATLAPAAPAAAASFPCSKASHPDEVAICANLSLNDDDVEMATLYQTLLPLLTMGSAGATRAFPGPPPAATADEGARRNPCVSHRITGLSEWATFSRSQRSRDCKCTEMASTPPLPPPCEATGTLKTQAGLPVNLPSGISSRESCPSRPL